jgi:molybdopterin converting factor small subunit
MIEKPGKTNGNGKHGIHRDSPGWEKWELTGLQPSPAEAWQRMQSFLKLGSDDFRAMVVSIEPLLKRAHELVVATYDHLLQDEETAVILGWESGADPAHLAERRRFFSVWVARLIGMDLSDEFAAYLFRAGQMHAAHGPRQVHVPPIYVTGSVSLVQAAFARFLEEEMPGDPVVPAALAGWNKLLSMHLHMMLTGYESAMAFETGDFPVHVRLFGEVRARARRDEVRICVNHGAPVGTLLRKFFDYYPHLRELVFETHWDDIPHYDEGGTAWSVPRRSYVVRTHPAWRVLLNGRNLAHIGGPVAELSPEDEIRMYSPGR